MNDVHGHAVGDQLLIAVAARLASLVRPGDTLARLSGDEFLFLCEDLTSPDDVDQLLIAIDQAFDAPFLVSDTSLSISASVGVAYSGPGEAVTNDLVSDADSAMYAAKQQRKGNGTNPRPGDRGRRDMALIKALTTDLRLAIAAESVELVYQPIVHTLDGRVLGVESLLRWRHPTRGSIPAPQIVAIAEQAGLIDQLGDWIIRRSCRDRDEWPRPNGRDPIDLAINLSAVQLLNPDLVRTVRSTLLDIGVAPDTIILEITENILIQDGPRALVVLRELKELGVRLALDDFGTGYSSLSHIHRFPIDIIKIDRSFVEHITLDPAAAAIVTAVTNLAHELGLRIVAEGAETELQVARLIEIGCDSSQGFYFSRPMSASDVDGMLRSFAEGSGAPTL